MVQEDLLESGNGKKRRIGAPHACQRPGGLRALPADVAEAEISLEDTVVGGRNGKK